ncbi:BLUF domain-containing protein [Dechloromonas sp. A34]|uniref:BLUF domain-containing protein n=1 Tax=Dechloromonas sp. A34 TaxID=447588 RepID=UPI002248EFAA|nr:BLUF domain-containing protein [Dechloromonas sp. A34]
METESSLTCGNLLRIVYLSKAEKAISEDDLQHVLKKARAFNSEHGMTGILIYSFGYFLQVLEGPEEVLLRCYLRISEDKRHSHVTLLHAVPIMFPMFSKWAMACLGEKDGISINFEDLLRSRFELANDTTTKFLLDRFLARVRAVDAN